MKRKVKPVKKNNAKKVKQLEKKRDKALNDQWDFSKDQSVDSMK